MNGELTWGIRESLLGYIDFLPDGSVTLSEDVGGSAEGPFVFASQEIAYEEQTCSGTFKFHGSVSIVAHGGALSANLDQPWIELSHSKAALSGMLAGGREPLISFALEAPVAKRGRLVWAAATYLTKAGAVWLGGHYAEGEEMDPLRLAVRLS